MSLFTVSLFNTSRLGKSFGNDDIQRASCLPCLWHVANSTQKRLLPYALNDFDLGGSDPYGNFDAVVCIQVLSAKQRGALECVVVEDKTVDKSLFLQELAMCHALRRVILWYSTGGVWRANINLERIKKVRDLAEDRIEADLCAWRDLYLPVPCLRSLFGN